MAYGYGVKNIKAETEKLRRDVRGLQGTVEWFINKGVEEARMLNEITRDLLAVCKKIDWVNTKAPPERIASQLIGIKKDLESISNKIANKLPFAKMV